MARSRAWSSGSDPRPEIRGNPVPAPDRPGTCVRGRTTAATVRRRPSGPRGTRRDEDHDPDVPGERRRQGATTPSPTRWPGRSAKGAHTPSILGVHGDLGKLIRGLKRRKPDLVFHLLEMFGGRLRGDVEVAGLLDLLEIPYTGGGPAELSLRMDKGLAKKALAFDKILYPDFAVFARDDFETGGNLRMPLFVKPLKADASIGIGADSLVHDAAALMKRVAAHPQEGRRRGAGRGVHRGARVLRRRPRQPRPAGLPARSRWTSAASPTARPASSTARRSGPRTASSTRGRGRSSPTSPTSSAPGSRRSRSTPTGRSKVRDYGRVDLRLTETGEIYVIEVNANCYLEQPASSPPPPPPRLDYPALINRIADLAASDNVAEAAGDPFGVPVLLDDQLIGVLPAAPRGAAPRTPSGMPSAGTAGPPDRLPCRLRRQGDAEPTADATCRELRRGHGRGPASRHGPWQPSKACLATMWSSPVSRNGPESSAATRRPQDHRGLKIGSRGYTPL